MVNLKIFIKNLKNSFTFIISAIITIIFISSSSSIYSLMNIEVESTEKASISILVQQVARAVATVGNITADQLELINKILPIEK